MLCWLLQRWLMRWLLLRTLLRLLRSHQLMLHRPFLPNCRPLATRHVALRGALRLNVSNKASTGIRCRGAWRAWRCEVSTCGRSSHCSVNTVHAPDKVFLCLESCIGLREQPSRRQFCAPAAPLRWRGPSRRYTIGMDGACHQALRSLLGANAAAHRAGTAARTPRLLRLQRPKELGYGFDTRLLTPWCRCRTQSRRVGADDGALLNLRCHRWLRRHRRG